MPNIKHYGWDVSPFSAKTRAYLKFKNIPFQDIVPSIRALTGKIERDAGQMIMPVVYDGKQAISDSTQIIDHFESSIPQKSILPITPKQRFTALFIELFADEWLPLAALHYRWNYRENRSFVLGEFGRSALPWLPRFIQKIAAKTIAGRMSGYLPVMGISEKMKKPLESNTETIMELLDHHFSTHLFILGEQPSLADFSLFGPLWAHLDRDPYPENLVAKHQHLKAWITRMNGDFSSVTATGWPHKDTVADTLHPLLHLVGETVLPLIDQSRSAIEAWCEKHPDAEKLPRKIGHATLTILGEQEKRLNLTYSYWMLQRIHRFYKQLTANEQMELLAWFDQFSPGFRKLLDKPLSIEVTLHRCRLWLDSVNTQASNAA